MKQKLLHLLIFLPFLMGFAGNVQAQEALSVAEISAQIQQAALTTAMTTSFQSPGTTMSTNGAGNAVTTTVGEVSIDATQAQTQIITVVTKDEAGNFISTIETTTTVEASQTNEPGARITQVIITKDGDGNQIGDVKTIETDFSYTFEINGWTYNTVSELLRALSSQPSGYQVDVCVTLVGMSYINDTYKAEITRTISLTHSQYKIGSSYSIEIPTTLKKAEGSDTEAASTQEIAIANKQTIKTFTLTIKVVDTDGAPVIDDQIFVGADYNYNPVGNLSESNTVIYDAIEGETVTLWCGNDKWREYILAEQTITANSDETIIFTIPKKVYFSILINNEINKREARIWKLDGVQIKSVFDSNTGTYSARIDPDKEYRVCHDDFEKYEYDDRGFVEGSIKITDGMTIRIGKLTVQTDGAGLAFPFAPFGTTSSYYVFVGNPVRLAAVPVGDSKFQCWSINGKEYTDALMDFEAKDDITVATAKFTENGANHIQSMDNNVKPINVTIEGNYLVLPAEVEASAGIYAVDGRQVKRTGVVGHRINISDLPAGAYVLTLTADGLRQSAQFVK